MADKDDVVTPDAPEATITPEVPPVLGTKDIITALVKDDDDTARAAFHQVLQTKMRDRINPPDDVVADATAQGDDETEGDGEAE